jgi:hypothetical protein
MDGFTIWIVCPSCNGTKVKSITTGGYGNIQITQVACTDCNEKGLKFFGYGYEKSFDEIPAEPQQ